MSSGATRNPEIERSGAKHFRPEPAASEKPASPRKNGTSMATVETIYLGELRTEATHVQSGSKILTDAPIDNHGKARLSRRPIW